MTVEETDFKGLLIIHPRIFTDSRGYFYESYNKKEFQEHGITHDFVQDNQVFSQYGSVRGLHFQLHPYAQTKLIRAVHGRILDVALDIRKGSPTYGKVFSIELSSENHIQALIPTGFAHGYSVLSESAVVQYKCDAYYAKQTEGGIRWDDETIAVDWKIPIDKMIISEKDQKHPLLKDCIGNFVF